MCRFIAYIGPSILADDLLYKPKFSLVTAQTMNAGEMSVSVNGDGFGIGFYAPELDNEPCVFRSIKPAWSDHNLKSLAKKINSPCMFAHVRAASPGMPVEEMNSHPFSCGQLMFMHNGVVGGFKQIRRKLLRTLNDTAYDAIHGSTDSEHLFGLFLNHIADPHGSVTCEEMVQAMNMMFSDLNTLLMESAVRQHSYLNLAVTNGTCLIAVRYTTNPNVQPASLYYMHGREYHCVGDHCVMEPSYGKPSSIVVASEPFTARRSDWMKVERNSMMVVDETMRIHFHHIEMDVEKLDFETIAPEIG
ncbi:MAG TPA: class II glutamine amidotransferase [Candidatus Didemnitutus sp.]|nr:class II glutamine amidotransferase [Candidatus Didemnitutus sp.]